ncbi:MAG: glycosyltransferase family 2 protein [Candidatus Chisholmbacteria bacterium]|nr:glycosyltransferase family 2 protein [Candidatus Chisholmbacteria bacterium]
MNKRLPTVTIGIPAYNEEKNIRRLLSNLLRQKEEGFVMQKIIVVDDGSTDRTYSLMQTMSDRRLVILKNNQRRGQGYSQNLIFEQAMSDVVVLLEADTLPVGVAYIGKLIAPLTKRGLIGLVQGNLRAGQSQTTIGKVLQTQAEIFLRWELKRKSNPALVISSGRGGRAFSRAVYKRLRWPQHVLEDRYATLWCQRKGFSVVWQRSAICLFRPEQTLNDFIRARNKIVSGYSSLLKYFGQDAVAAMYTCPRQEMWLMAKEFAVAQPVYFLLYALMKIYAGMLSRPARFSDFWNLNYSTKSLSKVTSSQFS